MTLKKKRKAFLLVSTRSHGVNKVPIYVCEIKRDDLFPVKFVYAQRGYSKSIFSAQTHKVIYN